MNADIFAEWLRRRGRRVLRTESSYWHDLGFRAYEAFPYHRVVDPPQDELRWLLGRKFAVAMRYCTPFERSMGAPTYQVVFDRPRYSLDDLSGNARKNVRKGLAHVEIEQIPLSRLANEGWALRYQTLERQGRPEVENRDWWQRMCTSAADLPGFEAWAALHEGRLVSSLLVFTYEDCVNFLFAQTATDHLSYRVANALYFAVTREMIERPGITQTFTGLESTAGVDEFKFRLSYGIRPVRRRTMFHPLLSPLSNRATLAVAQKLAARRPGLPTRIESMLRPHVQERTSGNDQEIPAPIAALLRSQSSGQMPVTSSDVHYG